MQDIALHIFDIIENSAKGGARRVELEFNRSGDCFEFRLQDDGPGLPPAVQADPTDPFATTRKDRKVGLGLALLRQAAERTGGSLTVESAAGRGVSVRAVFHLDHIDAQPVGDLAAVVADALAAWPQLDFVIRVAPPPRVVLDTAALRAEWNEIDFSQAKVHNYLRLVLCEGLAGVGAPARPRL